MCESTLDDRHSSVHRNVHFYALHRSVFRRVPIHAFTVQSPECLQRLGRGQPVQLFHFPPGQFEVEDIRILDHPPHPDGFRRVNESVLDAPPSENLGGRSRMDGSDPGQYGMVHGLPVPEGSVGLQYDALGSEVVDGVLAVEEGVDFDLIHGGPRRYPGVEELLVILHGVIRQPDVTYLPLPLQFLQSFVSLDVLSRHRPVY